MAKKKDAVGMLTSAVEALRSSVEIVDAAMRDVAHGAHDLEATGELPPDLPISTALRSRESVAFEFAARAVLPVRLPEAVETCSRALRFLRRLQKRVLPLPEATALPAGGAPTTEPVKETTQ